jgi:hypothetical protein
VFDDPEPAQLSARWIEELAHSSNSTGGIMLLSENIDADPPEPADSAPQIVDTTG